MLNFLAHFHLSGDNTDLIVGNFIADGVKGNRYNEYPDGIRKGILLHRFIDNFTDSHPVVMASKRRLHPEFHHYAAVITDVFYDHFLAKDWTVYSPVALPEYSTQIYSLLEENISIMPEEPRYMLPFMQKHNWLCTYQSVEGIDRVLTGMARRTSFVSGMEKAANALLRDYDSFKSEFQTFYPEIQSAARNFIIAGH